MARLLLLLSMVALLALGAWWWWTTTPEYSLFQVRSAIKGHDVAVFEKYVDIESVASNMVDTLLSRPLEESTGVGLMGRLIGTSIVGLIKPSLVEHAKDEIVRMVEGNKESARTEQLFDNGRQNRLTSEIMERYKAPAGQGSSADQDGESVSDKEPFGAAIFDPRSGVSFKRLIKRSGFRGKIYRGVEYKRLNDKVAFVGLRLYNSKYEKEITLEVKMRDMGGYWRVVELSNLPHVISTVLGLEMEYARRQRSSSS